VEDFHLLSFASFAWRTPFLAVDCLLAQPLGGPLTRKQPLKRDESAANYDPNEAHREIVIAA